MSTDLSERELVSYCGGVGMASLGQVKGVGRRRTALEGREIKIVLDKK